MDHQGVTRGGAPQRQHLYGSLGPPRLTAPRDLKHCTHWQVEKHHLEQHFSPRSIHGKDLFCAQCLRAQPVEEIFERNQSLGVSVTSSNRGDLAAVNPRQLCEQEHADSA